MDTSLPKFHNIQLQRHSLSYIFYFFLCFCFKSEPLVHLIVNYLLHVKIPLIYLFIGLYGLNTFYGQK
jgi:hypothetical protein